MKQTEFKSTKQDQDNFEVINFLIEDCELSKYCLIYQLIWRKSWNKLQNSFRFIKFFDELAFMKHQQNEKTENKRNWKYNGINLKRKLYAQSKRVS